MQNRYFQNEGREYVLKEYSRWVRPLLNYSWNPCFLSAFNHVATGHGLYCDKTTITATYIDPRGRVKLINDGNRYFYLYDADDGTAWNVAGYPMNTPLDDYTCTMGLGYAVYDAVHDGIRSVTRVFVDRQDPCEIWTIRLKNESDRKRTVRVFPLLEWSLEGYVPKSDYFSYLFSRADAEHAIVYAHNTASERLHDSYNGFLASSRPFTGFDTSLRAFLGTYGSFARPEALEHGHCTNTLGSCERLCAAMELEFTLEPGAEERVDLLIGAFEHEEEAQALSGRLFAAGAIDGEFERLREEKEERTQAVRLHTPDERINNLFNTWTKQQVVLCAQVGRGATRGYRDALQDAWGYTSFDADAARDKIVEALEHQYADGHAPRAWMPLDERHYSDSQVWIPMAVNGYLKETGDFAFLDREVAFLDGSMGTVWEHGRRAMEYLYADRGAHGLILAHWGDWNDSLTGLGKAGRGETAWTAIAMYFALGEMQEMGRKTGKPEADIARMGEMAAEIRRIVNDAAWDGEWFLEGFDDEGRAVGTHTEEEGRIYLNPQTWAVISGIADSARQEQVMRQVDEQLESPYGSLTLSPTYTKPNLSIGRLTEFVPGIWENGCPYCHGSAFKIVADCLLGRGDRAYATLQKVMPDAPHNPTEHSGCEPYAFTNMYLGPDNPRPGFAMFSWISGTAGWMFRAVTQSMIGFQPTYEGFRMNPCLPSAWDGCSFERMFRKNRYRVTIDNTAHVQSGVKRLELDGRPVEGTEIPYCEDGNTHTIHVVMG